MAKFITTILLHDAEKKDYDRLQNELKKESFKEGKATPVKNKNYIVWREYNREGNISLQEVSQAVVKAAEKTGKKFSFTVVRNKHIYN